MTVLYRKYRPQKISEIDSQKVREKLENILKSDRIPHAFLFSGPKGTGKTSSARIIAKSINCEKNNGLGEPCGKCTTCVSITNGANLDILEIDAASNRGIDEIRDLRDKIRLAPSSARKKVYIIDEVHMLTTEAANALLKTLEEPPEHVVFVLCTTNPEKLPETIISRCTRIDFRKAVEVDLVQALKRAKKGEGREIEEEALLEIALYSEGSYRDAHKLLEQVLTTCPEGPISTAIVKTILGEDILGDIFEWIFTKETKKGLEMVGTMVEKGVDFKFLTQTFLETFHKNLLKKYGIEREHFIYDKRFDDLKVEEMVQLINLFSQAAFELKTAVIPQLPLELAIVEWCEKGKGMEPEVSKDDSSSCPTILTNSGPVDSQQPPPSNKADTSQAEPTEIEGRWEEILNAVKPYNHSVAGLLRSCKPGSFDGQKLTIEVSYKFHFDKLREPKVVEILEKAVEETFKRKIKVFPKFNPKKSQEKLII